MALTGLEIYKLLPKTNCKECGFPTCLAFAMKLAQKGTELDKCPYVSDESKAALDAASAPPIRLVTVGTGERAFEIGNETVLYRHEKTFFHQPGLVVRVTDDDVPAAAAKAAAVAEFAVERVGMQLRLDGVVIEHRAAEAAAMAAATAAVRAAAPGLPIILMASDSATLSPAAAEAAGERPLLCAATADNWQQLAAVATEHGCALVVSAPDLSALAELTEQIKGAGVEDMVLDAGATGLGDTLAANTQLRRLALKKGVRALGYPLATPCHGTLAEQTVAAAQAICKYSGVIVLDDFDPAAAYALLTLRQNIYTDPQKPIQVEPKLYEVGSPTADSPVLITTNFSLTYFSVSGEIEASGMPAWLLVADSDGQSVLTGWAAGKFDAEKIARTVKDSGIESRVNHRKLVIPGHVAGLSGEVEEELPGWQIMVGPRDAVDIPNYLKNVWGA
jgi:acetyl-CoA decarbonylase/synthase, CODH/ACS complex subunit gamma